VEYDSSVLAITLFPGIRREVIEHVFDLPDVKGYVLRTYGSGNAPQRDWLINAIKKATSEGKVVVNVTQCQCGGVEMGLYETGIQLLQAGVVSGRDMTIEAVITKLMVLFGRGCSADEVRRLMGCSLAGEISVGDNCAVLS
jgi:L-asparaginase